MPAKTLNSKVGLGTCLKPVCTCRKACVTNMICFLQFYQLGQEMMLPLPENLDLGMVELGWWLDLMTLEDFSNLWFYDSLVLICQIFISKSWRAELERRPWLSCSWWQYNPAQLTVNCMNVFGDCKRLQHWQGTWVASEHREKVAQHLLQPNSRGTTYIWNYFG